MGNSSSAKNRHASGDDTAPTLTASGRYHDSSGVSFQAEQDMYEPAHYKVNGTVYAWIKFFYKLILNLCRPLSRTKSITRPLAELKKNIIKATIASIFVVFQIQLFF